MLTLSDINAIHLRCTLVVSIMWYWLNRLHYISVAFHVYFFNILTLYTRRRKSHQFTIIWYLNVDYVYFGLIKFWFRLKTLCVSNDFLDCWCKEGRSFYWICHRYVKNSRHQIVNFFFNIVSKIVVSLKFV